MMSKPPDDNDRPAYRFAGFDHPNTTPVPDVIFDEVLTEVTDAELRVLLYIVRRTYGFKKQNEGDAISLSQMVNGIKTRDGKVLDRGVGLSKATVARALQGLRTKGIIRATRTSSAEKGNEPTLYKLRSKGEQVDGNATPPEPTDDGVPPLVSPARQGVSHPRDTPLSQSRDKPLSHQRDTQQTVLQQTGKQHFEDSNGQPTLLGSGRSSDDLTSPTGTMTTIGEEIERRFRRQGSPPPDSDERAAGAPPAGAPLPPRFSANEQEQATLFAVVSDYRRKLHDEAPASSTVTRIIRAYDRSRFSLDRFLAELEEAYQITQRRSAAIRKKSEKNAGPYAVKNKAPYWLEVVEQRTTPDNKAAASGPATR